MCAHAAGTVSATTLETLTPRERIVALADSGTVESVDAAFEAPRPSPHLARWGIAAQDDDGIVVARAAVRGAPVLVAAQDERFLRGSVGAHHGETLRRLFVHAETARPAAVVLLFASAGVRLHEANPAELALARALAALLDLRASGVPVLAICVADTFGATSVLACAAEHTVALPGTRIGLSGPAVVELMHGKQELDAADAAAVGSLYGAEARRDAGQIDLVAAGAGSLRAWVADVIGQTAPFADWVRATQERLERRLVEATRADHEETDERTLEVAIKPVTPLPRKLASLYADAQAVDRVGWLWRMADRPVWLSRPFGVGTFGPREAHGLDAALLVQLLGGDAMDPGAAQRTVFLVGDSFGHEASRAAETLCVSQYLAQHAAVVALLRDRGVRVRGLLTGIGHSAAFFANALQAQEVYALEGSRVVAMEPAAIARVTRLPEASIAALLETDPVLGQPVRQFAHWGGIDEILPDADRERLLALTGREPRGGGAR
jgi:malonate decarboxylase beta subunit